MVGLNSEILLYKTMNKIIKTNHFEKPKYNSENGMDDDLSCARCFVKNETLLMVF